MMVLRQLRLPRRCVCGKCDGMRATSRDGPASPVATSFGIKMFSQLKLRTKEPCISNVLLQIYLQLQIYLACNDSLYPLFLWKKVGLRSTFVLTLALLLVYRAKKIVDV